jgi:hypothetical protein
MDPRLPDLTVKPQLTKNQATSARLTAEEQPQPDSVLRMELIEVTALLAATLVAMRQFSVEWRT